MNQHAPKRASAQPLHDPPQLRLEHHHQGDQSHLQHPAEDKVQHVEAQEAGGIAEDQKQDNHLDDLSGASGFGKAQNLVY